MPKQVSDMEFNCGKVEIMADATLVKTADRAEVAVCLTNIPDKSILAQAELSLDIIGKEACMDYFDLIERG